MEIFIDVDVQNDFCDPKGALYVAGSPNDVFRSLVRAAKTRGAALVGSVDSHAFDAWEFASSGKQSPTGEAPGFPDHCVKGTWGWLKVDGTLPKRFRFVPNVAGLDMTALAEEVAGRVVQGVYFEKEVYSLFVNPNAAALLSELARIRGESLEARVFGVATDYCVKAAAIGLCQRGIATTVFTDAIAAITPEGGARALDEMKAAGARLATLADLGIT
jgi:nicotinamidase/pyrazinamidase